MRSTRSTVLMTIDAERVNTSHLDRDAQRVRPAGERPTLQQHQRTGAAFTLARSQAMAESSADSDEMRAVGSGTGEAS